MIHMIKALAGHGDLIWNLVTRDFKIRYRGSVLGFLWTIEVSLYSIAS